MRFKDNFRPFNLQDHGIREKSLGSNYTWSHPCLSAVLPQHTACPLHRIKWRMFHIGCYMAIALGSLWVTGILLLFLALARRTTCLLLPHLLLQAFLVLYCFLLLAVTLWNHVHRWQQLTDRTLAMLVQWPAVKWPVVHSAVALTLAVFELFMYCPVVRCYHYLRDVENNLTL